MLARRQKTTAYQTDKAELLAGDGPRVQFKSRPISRAAACLRDAEDGFGMYAAPEDGQKTPERLSRTSAHGRRRARFHILLQAIPKDADDA